MTKYLALVLTTFAIIYLIVFAFPPIAALTVVLPPVAILAIGIDGWFLQLLFIIGGVFIGLGWVDWSYLWGGLLLTVLGVWLLHAGVESGTLSALLGGWNSTTTANVLACLPVGILAMIGLKALVSATDVIGEPAGKRILFDASSKVAATVLAITLCYYLISRFNDELHYSLLRLFGVTASIYFILSLPHRIGTE